jgi:outer membrane biogenesis lipoprotein LolB
MIILVAGCSSVPFQKTRYVPLDKEALLSAVAQYERRLPEYVQLLNTMVIEYNWKKLSCLGVIELDMREHSYAVACLSPLGVKLFEVSGSRDGVRDSYVLGDVMRDDTLINTIGEDLKRIYFDLAPSSGASIIVKKDRALLRRGAGPGIMKYEFGGEDISLINKSYYEQSVLRWKVSYYEYQEKDGALHPGGIVLNNYGQGYRLTLALKEILN